MPSTPIALGEQAALRRPFLAGGGVTVTASLASAQRICFEITRESWLARPSGHLRVQSHALVDDHHVAPYAGAPR